MCRKEVFQTNKPLHSSSQVTGRVEIDSFQAHVTRGRSDAKFNHDPTDSLRVQFQWSTRGWQIHAT